MNRKAIYYTCLFFMLALSACENPFTKGKTNWEVSLKKEDKKPYGSYLSYQSLKYYFPKAKVETLSEGFRYTSIDDNMHFGESRSLLILLGLDFYISADELEELVTFAQNGNEVILFCSRIDSKIENRLHIYKQLGGREERRLTKLFNGKENINALALAQNSYTNRYGYEGRSLQSYFSVQGKDKDTADILSNLGEPIQLNNDAVDEEDSVEILTADTLGLVNNAPDFVRYSIGDGHITLHAAPLVMSNYFLLQPGNKSYLDGIWHTLPANISHVYWNEYYKHRAERSGLDVLWRYPATRWALIMAIITLLLYVLFESKRRQKIIPVIEQPGNTSVSFVETVGRLYYNKGNHSNLAEKMIQHFLEWVRTYHYLNTNQLNYEFIQQLAKRTGEPESTVSRLVEMIHEIRLGNVQPDEPYLYELYNTIQQFYKNEKL